MNKKIVDNSLPEVFATEDTIFNICMVEIKEFPQYMTNLDDIIGYFPDKLVSPEYRNLRLDSVRLRENGNLANIEHHSVITSYGMRRDYGYMTSLHAATGRIIEPFIFNTGEIPNFSIEYANPTMFYNPVWINTQEIEASVKLNNIKFKVLHDDVINVWDILDLIWMPKFRSDNSIEELILEVIGLYSNLICSKRLLLVLRECLILWAGKFVKQSHIHIVEEGLKLSAMETRDLSAMIRMARIDGALCRSREEGYKEGLEKGLAESRRAESKIISKLLETHEAEEISKEFDISLERVLEIKNGHS